MPETLAVITEEIEDEAETLGDVERSTRGRLASRERRLDVSGIERPRLWAPGPLWSLEERKAPLGNSGERDQLFLAAVYCARPNCASSCSIGRKPTTPIGCWPGRKNAIVGML